MIQSPMLAARAESEADIVYPCWATPKIDGIRCLRVGEDARTRSFKHVRNDHIRELVKQLPEGLDGELVAGGQFDFDFQATTSAVMRCTGAPDFRYWVFDWYTGAPEPYEIRFGRLTRIASPYVIPVLPTRCESAEALLEFEAECLEQGFEGVCTRSPGSPYKFGRSSLREQWLVKLKRYCDSEMRVTGFIEAVENTNEQVSDNFGYARRPGGRSNSLPKGTLGSLVGTDVYTGVDVRVGTGLTDAQRQRVWDDRTSFLGKVVKYRHQATGVKVKRRFTSFLGFRDPEDMS